jgi:hypothetical protein
MEHKNGVVKLYVDWIRKPAHIFHVIAEIVLYTDNNYSNGGLHTSAKSIS